MSILNRRAHPEILRAFPTFAHTTTNTSTMPLFASLLLFYKILFFFFFFARSRANIQMEFNNFIYNVEYKLLICIKHQSALSSIALKNHFRGLHKLKNERLHAIFTKTQNLNVQNFNDVLTFINSNRILHLFVKTGYQCTACKHMNKHRRSIEKYFSKNHNINHVKGKKKSIDSDIACIHVQFFFHVRLSTNLLQYTCQNNLLHRISLQTRQSREQRHSCRTQSKDGR